MGVWMGGDFKDDCWIQLERVGGFVCFVWDASGWMSVVNWIVATMQSCETVVSYSCMVVGVGL